MAWHVLCYLGLVMKSGTKLVITNLVILGFAMSSRLAFGADLPDLPRPENAPPGPPASNQPLLAIELPGQSPFPPAGMPAAPSGPGSRPDRAEAAPRAEPPPRSQTLQSLAEQFNASRDQLLKKREMDRKQLLEKLRSASADEQKRLILEFREKQRLWLEEQKVLAEEFRVRLQSIRDEFKNRERDQLLDEVKGKAREIKDRLGKD